MNLARTALDAVARIRARRHANRIERRLPDVGLVLDVGSGTGHLIAELVRRGRRAWGCDVADIHSAGSPPVLFDGRRLPFPDRSFGAVVAAHMLQYVDDPVALLTEMGRVTSDRVIIMQSTCRGRLGRLLRAVEEPITGVCALRLAQSVGFAPPGAGALRSLRRVRTSDVKNWSREAGLRVRSVRQTGWPVLAVELAVLERTD